MKEENTCDKFVPDLKAYQDGQLGWWARQRVRRHVADCAQCREEMQAMRDFSRFLQGGEGESLSPQLRARILAAVPETVPASAPARLARSFNRPVLAWGAVASALLLCIVLSPLFWNNDHSARKMAVYSTPTMTSSKDENGSAGGSSASGGMTGNIAVSTRTAEAGKEMKAASPPMIAAPTASEQEPSAVTAPGMAAGKPAPSTAMPADKSAAAADIATSVTKSAPEPQRYLSSGKSADFDSSVSHASGTGERAASPSSPRTAAPQDKQVQADGKAVSGPLRNNGAAASDAAPSSANTESAVSGAITSNQSVGMTPPMPAAATLNNGAPKKTNHAMAKTSGRSDVPTSDILLLVGNVEQSLATLEQAVKSSGGAITAVKDITYGDSSQAAMLTLHVPAAQLSALLSEVNAMGDREPFALAPNSRRVQSHNVPASGGNSVPALPTNNANVTANSRLVTPFQPDARSYMRIRNKADGDTLPSAPANARPKSPANAAKLQSSASVTIHLQEKPRK